MLLTRCSIRTNPVSAISRWIRSLFRRSTSRHEPAEGWFTLDAESADGKRPDAPLVITEHRRTTKQRPLLPP
jgi:hypothetical protein